MLKGEAIISYALWGLDQFRFQKIALYILLFKNKHVCSAIAIQTMMKLNKSGKTTHTNNHTGSRYSGTSINGHLIKAVTYRNAASIAGPKRPLYVHNVLLSS